MVALPSAGIDGRLRVEVTCRRGPLSMAAPPNAGANSLRKPASFGSSSGTGSAQERKRLARSALPNAMAQKIPPVVVGGGGGAWRYCAVDLASKRCISSPIRLQYNRNIKLDDCSCTQRHRVTGERLRKLRRTPVLH